MKQTVFLLLLSTILLSLRCKKDKSVNPVDQLPPETQTGANTFGCLVNGTVFLPKRPFGDIVPFEACIYQQIYSTPNGFVFGVSATNKTDGCNFKVVGLRIDSVKLIEGSTYTLLSYKHGNGNGQVSESISCSPLTIYQTNNNINGEFHLVRLDTVNQIVSGSFWFDAINDSGQKVQVREGRFDMHYTR